MQRNQIDLVDMKEETVSYLGVHYRWILSVQDIFSRFLWLRALPSKKSSVVAEHLKLIYREHGTPKILQCDNGGEFGGNTKKLCRIIGVKIINSRAYHPQSQGKVERSHRTIREKIRYDLLQQEANWVKFLPEYQSILNDDTKLELGGKSPFEIYFGRKSNFVLKPNADSDDDSEGEAVINQRKEWPCLSKQDIHEVELRKELLHKSVYDSNSKCAKTMINRALKRNPIPIYMLNERVVIRYPFTGGRKVPKRRSYVLGKVVSRNIISSKYRIEFKNPIKKKKKRPRKKRALGENTITWMIS